MSPRASRRAFALSVVFLLGLGVALAAAAAGLPQEQPRQPPRRERPPEYAEYQVALKIPDPTARLRELERLRTAYPASQIRPLLESAIVYTKIQMAATVEEAVQLQEPVIRSADGLNAVFIFYSFSWDILRHPNAAKFDKQAVTEAVLGYAARGMALARDPAFQKTVPAEQLRFLNMNWPNFYLVEAAAHLNGGNVPKAVTALDSFKREGKTFDEVYDYIRGDLNMRLGRENEALESYLSAAAQNYGDAPTKARSLYQKLRGSLDGFEAALEARLKRLPYEPGTRKPAGKWSGKAVLAELFTGSECPPCVASDIGFDGLIEAFDPKYLAVLEYHVPIPRPDPMMNHATRKRLQVYAVSSTPSTFFDGQAKGSGGGNRAMAEEKFREYAAEIESRLMDRPEIRLAVQASLEGDSVRADFTVDRIAAGADLNLVLVQKEVRHRGSNGIVFHRMVVKEFVTLSAADLAAKTVSVSVPESEAAAARRLDEAERQGGFKFADRKDKIDRSQLRVVLFAQDRETRRVLNAVVADVR